ncbi:TetR/AcrR family transcriptional regulator [Nocardia blacklockiae]|uniref:TetR/AcrR family transcriptional regulator n=1 Tax=Nocardia blacklockiae TaxID=480036 RepID=UPI002B4B230C|nr:TetR/AcrR family transcriptional regulator [Nocardia blacklockiae]
MPALSSQHLRSDARDNRAHLLDTARALFLTAGLDVPIREIARRAEVAPATVYRHFPTKQLLLTEVYAHQLHAWQSALTAGLADPDPWHGFSRMVEKLCALRAHDHNFTAAFKSAYPRALDFTAIRKASLTTAAELITRTKNTGHLRPDITLHDLTLMLTAIDGIRTPAPRTADSHRYATHILRAFRAIPSPQGPVPNSSSTSKATKPGSTGARNPLDNRS